MKKTKSRSIVKPVLNQSTVCYKWINVLKAFAKEKGKKISDLKLGYSNFVHPLAVQFNLSRAYKRADYYNIHHGGIKTKKEALEYATSVTKVTEDIITALEHLFEHGCEVLEDYDSTSSAQYREYRKLADAAYGKKASLDPEKRLQLLEAEVCLLCSYMGIS